MSECAGSTLKVYQTESDRPDNSTGGVVISKQVRKISEERANDLYQRLTHLDIDHNHEVPIYRILCHHIWRDGGTLHDHSPYSMELLVILYEYLEDQITDQTVQIVCHGVSGRYKDIVADLAVNEDLELEVEGEVKESRTDRNVLIRGLIRTFVALLDLLLSVLLKPFFTPLGTNVALDFPAGRPGTFRPIETRLNRPIDTVFTTMTISYLRHFRTLSTSSPDMPLNCYETPTGILKQFKVALNLIFDLYVTGRTAEAVVAAVEGETGIKLDRTVGRLYLRAAAFDIDALLKYGPAQRAIETNTYEAVVLTSTGPTGKAIGCAAEENSAAIFHLPHSMSIQYTGLDVQFPHTMFSEGEIVRPVAQSDPSLEVLETGMPKHIELYGKRSSLSSSGGDGQILVGTQPYDDARRETFVIEVLAAVLETTERDIVIKIHPGEQQVFYTKLIDGMNLSPEHSERVTVTADGLYQHIVDSDLMVTISSNVGIEAVILGTPTVSFNPWTPDNRSPLYSKFGEIPEVESRAELSELLRKEDLEAMRDKQASMLKGPYKVVGNSLNDIAGQVEREVYKAVDNADNSVD